MIALLHVNWWDCKESIRHSNEFQVLFFLQLMTYKTTCQGNSVKSKRRSTPKLEGILWIFQRLGICIAMYEYDSDDPFARGVYVLELVFFAQN